MISTLDKIGTTFADVLSRDNGIDPNFSWHPCCFVVNGHFVNTVAASTDVVGWSHFAGHSQVERSVNMTSRIL